MPPPTVSKAKTSYPIFAASWSTRPGYLLVGGGGGAGNHGIKNKITLFDFQTRAPNVEACAEVDASEDDSVTCLESMNVKNGLILYAGINSSEDDRSKGKNEHFRSFEVQLPASRGAESAAGKQDAKITFLSKTQILTPPVSVIAAKDSYQRLVRLSPPPRTASNTPNRRIGAIASSLGGDENELVIFSATSNLPQSQDIIERIKFSKGQEANDLDIFDHGDGRFQVAYALDQDVYVQDVNYDFGERKIKSKIERKKLYTLPTQDLGDKQSSSKLRCIRWLSPKHLLLLANKPQRTGVDLLTLHLYEEGPPSIIKRRTLKHIKAAADMDVALLDADSDGAYQIVVAIGAINMSLSVYTMDYYGTSKDSLSHFHSFNIYYNVHDIQMTKVVLSKFVKPEIAAGRTVGPQVLRLVSTSLGNTISVETFELQLYGGRYVLQTKQSRTMSSAASVLTVTMVVAVIALLIQTLLGPTGSLFNGVIPVWLRDAAGQEQAPGESIRDKRHEAILNNANSPIAKTSHRIADLLHLHLPHVLSHNAPPSSQKALIIHDLEGGGELSTEVHDDHETVLQHHAEAKKWDDLSKEEKILWKNKLQDAGVWAVGEGEIILKSIFFGQIGGLVGQVAQGVLG